MQAVRTRARRRGAAAPFPSAISRVMLGRALVGPLAVVGDGQLSGELMRTLKLMSDYGCHPLWEASTGGTGNVDPASLPLTADLQRALRDWALRYDATLDQDDPRQSGFPNEEREASFMSDGAALAKRLQDELGPDYAVVVKL